MSFVSRQAMLAWIVDYIDTHQCHRFDTETPIAETVRAYDDLIRMGKVLYWGVSEWSAEQIALACEVADQMGACRPISNQPGYSIMRRSLEQTVLPECKRLGIGQFVFSPLGQGVLTGKYCGGAMPEGSRATDAESSRFMGRYLAAEELDKVESLIPLAEDLGITLPQLALAWCLRESGLASVILGATKPEQLDWKTFSGAEQKLCLPFLISILKNNGVPRDSAHYREQVARWSTGKERLFADAQSFIDMEAKRAKKGTKAGKPQPIVEIAEQAEFTDI